MRVLVCEDDQDIAEILSCYLGGHGFDVDVVADGGLAVDAFERCQPDCVLLDVLLPTRNGWEVLHSIRERASTPVIMVSALGRTEDIVRGLEAGADDYIAKPFDPEEVRARIEVALRRSRSTFTMGPVVIDDSVKKARVDGRTVPLSPKEYRLLTLLVSRRGEVVTTEEIMEHLWPDNPLAASGDVQKYVYLLRRKIEEEPSNPQLLLTVRGFGYRLEV
jgi:DNA-binding response OmpR family regulator